MAWSQANEHSGELSAATDTGGHEAVRRSHACASTSAGLEPAVPTHLLLASMNVGSLSIAQPAASLITWAS